jgi:hypothetical protein
MNGSPTLFARAGRVIMFAVVLSLLGAPAMSQPVRIGFRTGPAFGFLSDSPIPFARAEEEAGTNTNVRMDLHGGVYAIVPLAYQFGLQTELLYVRKGGHFSHLKPVSYKAERYQLSYVQGQVLGRRDIEISGPLQPHALAGLTLEGLLEGTARRNVNSPKITFREEIDLKAQNLVQQWDIGGLVGMGVSYPIGATGRIGIELRYNLGFRSIFTQAARPPSQTLEEFRDPSPLTQTPPPLRHDVITASLAYTIPLDW